MTGMLPSDGKDDAEEGEDDDEEDEDEDAPLAKHIDVPVAMWDFDHCDPKRCSGKKLERHGLIKSMRIGQKFRGIVLTWVSAPYDPSHLYIPV